MSDETSYLRFASNALATTGNIFQSKFSKSCARISFFFFNSAKRNKMNKARFTVISSGSPGNRLVQAEG